MPEPSCRLDRATAILAALCVTEVVSWGIIYYSPAVFILPMEGELGWSRAEISAGLSLGLLTSAVMAVPVGRWLDRRGPRLLMTVGSCGAAALVLALSQVASLPAYYAIWAGLGLTMAAVLYEPAFATLAAWYGERRTRALTVLSLAGALASTAFLPLANTLLSRLGWRGAVAALGVILAVVTIPLHALVLRQAPPRRGRGGVGESLTRAALSGEEASLSPREAVRSVAFRALTSGLVIIAVVNAAVAAHSVPFLIERGFPSAMAAGLAGAVGAMQLVGRVVFGVASGRAAPRWLTVAVFGLQAIGLAWLAAAASLEAVLLFVLLYGMGHGMTTLVRAARVADFFGPANYGAISGVLAFWSTGARAGGPIVAGWLYTELGGYPSVFWLLAVLALVAAVAGWIAEVSALRGDRPNGRAR